MRTLLFAVPIFVAVASPLACRTKAEPLPQNETGTDAGTEPGAQPRGDGGSTATVDTTKLGASCTNSDACKDGGCFEFGAVEPPIDGGRCADVTNGCEVVTCSVGYECIATGGDPSEITCR